MHAKAKAALTKVVNPAIFDVPDGHVPKQFNGSISSAQSINTASQPWNSKVRAPTSLSHPDAAASPVGKGVGRRAAAKASRVTEWMQSNGVPPRLATSCLGFRL